MATTNFSNGVTLTDAGWFNDVDAAVYEGTLPSGATALTVTGATTLAVYNTIATTVNAFGAASTALNIGHASAAAAFAGGISIPTGKNVTGTGTAQVTGFATVSATTLTGTLSTAAQTNITSVGTLTGLVLGGNVTESGGARSITVTGNITGAAISGTTGTFSATPLKIITATGNAYLHAERNSQSAGQVGVQLGGGTSGTDWIIYQAISSNTLSIFGNSADRLTITDAGVVTMSGTTINMTTSGTTLTVGVGADNGTVSAGVFTDRTKAFDGDALTELCKVKSKGGHIDHNSLPAFVRENVRKQSTDEEGKVTETVEVERNIGATVSMLVRAVQQIEARLP